MNIMEDDGRRLEAAGGFRVYRANPGSWSYSARESTKPQSGSEMSGKHNRKCYFTLKSFQSCFIILSLICLICTETEVWNRLQDTVQH